jgi:hydrogenase maturation protease
MGYHRAVIVDALVDPCAEAGAVRRLDVSECYGQAPPSPHTSGFHEGLAMGRAVGLQVPSAIALYGIVIREPQCFAEGLSRELESRLPTIVASITDAEFAAARFARFTDGAPKPRAA